MERHETALWTRWRALIAEQQQSGESIVGFCWERGLKAKRFSVWKRRFREARTWDFVAVEAASAAEPKPRLPAVEPEPPISVARCAAIEVRLARGQSLMVEPGFDAGHLRALLTVLEA